MTSRRRPRRSARATLAIVTAAVTMSAVALAGSAGAAPSNTASGMYLVQLAGAPIAAYTGGVNGIAAPSRRPAPSWTPRLELRRYREYLRAKRAEVLGKAKIDKKKSRRVRHRAQRRRREADRVPRSPSCGRPPGVAQRLEERGPQARHDQHPAVPRASTAPAASGTRQFGGAGHAGEGVIVGVDRLRRLAGEPELRRRCPSRGPTPTSSPPSGTASCDAGDDGEPGRPATTR